VCGEKTGKEEDDRERGDEEEKGQQGVLSPHRAAVVIQRVNGQGVDSELLPWTEEDDEAVEVGLGLF
jgi:hypothetical protein